jgi:diguanylate cyclase (GGDEF)-like protein
MILELGNAPKNALLFLNISPKTLAEPDLSDLREVLPKRVGIEITEQEAVADYEQVQRDLMPWLSGNIRLAIDDAGAGHSSLRHVVELLPDYVKIDRSLIAGIDTDRNRRALLRSLVTFAHEVGITVIAEGVETPAELEVVRDAEVDLGQGYLFARPGRARDKSWPQVALTGADDSGTGTSATSRSLGSRKVREEQRLLRKLDRANDAKSACEAVVDYLFRRGKLMPSLYLELEGQLRCIAQRGLWQVLDGMTGSAGITGKTWASGRAIVEHDVRANSDYLEALPGVTSEICVPVICNGATIGALNVESLTPLAPDTIEVLNHCIELLVRRLKQVGWTPGDIFWRRASRASVEISRLAFEDQTPQRDLEVLREAASTDSACLIGLSNGTPEVLAATGPLEDVLRSLPDHEMVLLAKLVDNVNSCYSANKSTGRSFIGTDSIRAFVRAVIVMPLRSGGTRIGTVVLAHSRPRELSSNDVEPLELIAGHLAAMLDAADNVTRLRREASHDQLTGLGTRAALEIGLRSHRARADSLLHAALIIDCDHFKSINHRFGHVTGDSALRALAQHLREYSPALQMFRYGGDEFVSLLPFVDSADVVAFAESLCEQADVTLSPFGSSVTAGLTLPHADESPWATLSRADMALVGAKRRRAARSYSVQPADTRSGLGRLDGDLVEQIRLSRARATRRARALS